MNDTPAASRSDVLARYRPIRVSIVAVLRQAVDRCRKTDFDRAAKHLDLWDDDQLDDGAIVEMLSDIALMEPNQRGRRAYDRFLQAGLAALGPPDRAVAERMGEAVFSIFRVAERHGVAGLWLEDLLAADRRLWLVDEGLEASARDGLVIAMRVFDAGPFHAGFGIIVVPAADLVGYCVEAAAAGRPLPVRRSLAATLYGEAIVLAALRDAADVG